MIAGDAIDVCPALGRQLPPGEPRVVFHAATRMLVAQPQRAAFDEAIDSIGQGGPLYHASLEPASSRRSSRRSSRQDGLTDNTDGALALHGPGDRHAIAIARVDGHLEWAASCPRSAR